MTGISTLSLPRQVYAKCRQTSDPKLRKGKALMKRRSLLILCGSLWGISAAVVSQGVCIPPAIKTHAVQGYVFWKSDGKPMPGMRIELLTFDQRMTKLADTQPGPSGFFEISYPGPGRYWLRAKNDQIPGLTVEVRVEGKASPKGKQDYIHFLLSVDPQKYCWGSSVNLIRSDQSDAESKRVQ